MVAPATKWGLIALAVVAILPLLFLAILSLTSRRPAGLGPVSGKLRDCPDKPNCVCSCQQTTSHAIAPLVWKGDPRAGLDRLRQVLQQFPQAMVEPVQDERYLHAEFKSAWFQFVDDVEFLVDPEAGVIHVRSASRAGQSDFGVNRKRVEQIRQLFEARE